MAVDTKEDLIERLKLSARRMKEVREAAETLRLIRRGNEPDPTPLAGGIAQPAPSFVGQPIRPNPSAS